MAEKIIFDFDFGGNTEETTEELNSLKEELEGVKGELSAIKKSQKGTQKALGGIAKGFKGVGLAMKSAGIGLIIEAFNFLRDIVMQNQKVVDALSIATTTLSIVFNEVASVIGNLVDTLKSPKKALQDLQDKFEEFKTYISEKFSGVGTLLSGIFTGNFGLIKAGFEQLKVGVTQIADDVTDVLDVVADKGKKAFNQATEIQNLRNEVKLLEAEQRKLNFTYLNEQELQRQIRDDVTKTFEERIEANDKLAESLNKQFEDEKAILDEKLRLAKLESEANKDNIDLQAAVIEQEAELADLQERINGFRSEQIVNRVALEKESKEALDELKLAELDEKELEFEALRQEYEAKLELARLAGADTEAIEEQYLLNKKALQDKFTQEEIDATKKKNDELKKENDKKNKALELSDKARRQAVNNGIQMLESLFAGNEKAEKAFALAKIGVDTAKAISSLTANSEANPANAVTFGGAGIIQFATGLIRIFGNIASAKKILNSKGKSTPSASASGGGSRGGSTIPSANTVPQIDTSAMFDLSSSTSIFSQQPIQAYVVQQDVEDQNEISNQIQNRATL